MSLADSLKPLLSSVRSIPGQLGLRPHTVEVLLGTWSGAQTGEGAESISTVSITENGQPPKIRRLKPEERALDDLPEGSVEIGPVTPDFAGGGFDLQTIRVRIKGATLHFRITGPDPPQGSAVYRVTQAHADFALHYTFVCVPVSNA